jgi:hypothetical protein
MLILGVVAMIALACGHQTLAGPIVFDTRASGAHSVVRTAS